MRKARRMLLHHTLPHTRTDPAGTCGRDCHRRHESRCAGSGSSFSDRTRKHGESTHEPARRRNNASQRLLAATALRSAHALLVVVHSETSTYSSHHAFELPTGSLHNADRVGSGVVGVSATVGNSSIRNHLEAVRNGQKRGGDSERKSLSSPPQGHTHYVLSIKSR